MHKLLEFVPRCSIPVYLIHNIGDFLLNMFFIPMLNFSALSYKFPPA